MNPALWVRLGTGLMFLAVGLGAFGAHALKSRLSPDMLAVFETGVRYQAYHALALTGARRWGAVTPIGGLLFLIGWLCLLFGRYRFPDF